jgi:hypothetical protein
MRAMLAVLRHPRLRLATPPNLPPMPAAQPHLTAMSATPPDALLMPASHRRP